MKGLNRQIVRAASTASMAVDAYPNNVTLLVNFYGTNGDSSGVGFQDESWNNWTPSQAVSETQNATLTNAVSYYGPTSLDQSYTTNYGTATKYSAINWAIPTGTTATTAATVVDMSRDYTIEGWVYYISLPSVGYQNYFFSSDTPNNYTYNSAVNGIRLGARDNGELVFYLDNGTDQAPPAQNTAGSVKFTAGSWYHWAIVRKNNTIGAFLNGTAATGSWLVNSGTRTHNQAYGYCRIGTDVQKAGTPIYIGPTRVTNGIARYTPGTNFTPLPKNSRFPLVQDPYRPYVTTHLRFNNSVVDTSQKQISWTTRGTLAYNSGGSKAFGTHCVSPRQGASLSTMLYIPTSGDTTIFSPGTGDFTIESWVYRTTTASGYGMMFDNRPFATASTSPSTGTYQGLAIEISSTILTVYAQGNSLAYGSNISGSITHGIASTTWTHVALSRINGTTRLFVNGVLKGSYADTYNYGFNTASGAYAGTGGTANTYCRIGESNGAANNNNGMNYDEFRITVGVGRYNAAFTPPTAPFPGA